MVWKLDNPQGNEAAKIKYEIVRYTNGKGLDLGCGPFKTFQHFIGVDNGHHWGTQGVDVVTDCEKLDIFATNSLDFVFSSHLLEHIEDTKAALKEWLRVIKPGGHLVLYLPHKSFYPNIGEEGSNPHHKHDFMPQDIVRIMRELYGWDLVRNENRNEGEEYSFLQVYRKRNDKHHNIKLNSRPKKSAAVVRYGAFGDMIQASSILPGLKKQGYHITFYTTDVGKEILKENPYIDDFFIQGKDQVPNHELVEFWKTQAAHYDKFINLSESVEGTFLAMKGRTAHSWNHSVRKKMLNVNYLEFTHWLAEVPEKFEAVFYPSEYEKKWAKAEKSKHGKVIMWALAGSSVHKLYPHLDTVIARILSHTDYKVVLVGNDKCRILEQGWEEEPRVIRKSGEWSIRKTMAFSLECDLVIGPETGIMNCVGLEDVPMIIFLSHSSEENLTKHFKNCIPLTPENCDCYPCHLMHYGWDNCKKSEKEPGVSECAYNISPDKTWNAICEVMKWRSVLPMTNYTQHKK